MDLQIKRICYTDQGVFGVLVKDDFPVCLTLELPDRDNQKNISCIPEGNYLCKRVQSPSHGNTFEVCHVPHRSHILFHKGNTAKDAKGCILLGRFFGSLDGKPGIMRSSEAFAQFLEISRGSDKFNLNISKNL